jgi:hypothetical protein
MGINSNYTIYFEHKINCIPCLPNQAATAVVDPMEGGGAEKDVSQAADGDQQPPEKLIIYARTENVITEPIEITRDIRVSEKGFY